MNKKQEPDGLKVIEVNKKAGFNYHLLEKFETGIVLTGGEIKSIRQGHISLTESYVAVQDNELFLLNAHINQYSHDTDLKYDPRRKRKLLMHRLEIDRLRAKVEQKGLTIVPTRIYLKKGRAKLEIALAKGKAAPDKRDVIKDRERKRDAERAMKSR